VKTLLLDVMGTIVYDPFFIEVPAHFEISLEELMADKHPTAWLDFEKDLISESEFYGSFFGDCRPFDGLQMKEVMRSGYRYLDGMEELLQDLKAAGVPMHALSNYPDWYLMIEERLGLSRYLDWSFVSCRTGHRKPAAQAYSAATETLGVPPSLCVFVDDRGINCKAAAAFGMHAIKFTDAASLRMDLASLGMLRGSG
jgi:FMN hydrolase / 5-amino-6-(5-phospho-D-ribitylamino)uracil phosphatase